MNNYWGKRKTSDYFLTMGNLHAAKLKKEAEFVSLVHIKDGLTRIQFQDEIQSFIHHQLNVIKHAESEKECMICVHNLRQELESIKLQDQQINTGQAKLYAVIELVRNGDTWGYVIQGVGIALGGVQIVAGASVILSSIPMGNIVGVGLGAMLVLHGFNGILEGIENLNNSTTDSAGFMKSIYIETAKFLGFDKKVGEMAYYGADLVLSGYGLLRFVMKKNPLRLVKSHKPWRLYYYMPNDFIRGVQLMAAPELAVEVYSDGSAIKSIYDSLEK